MSGRNFNQALREVDAARANRSLPAEAEQRIRERIDRAQRRQWWSPAYPVAAALAAACLALVAYSWWRSAEQVAPASSEVKGFVAESGGSARTAPEVLRSEGDHVVATAHAQVFDFGSRIHVEAQPGAAFAHDPRGLKVLSGTVELAVNKRHPGEAPAAVLVSDGAIEILGTRFTVVQRAQDGEVTLHEGRIQFVANDGRIVILHPGESLHWPLPPKLAQNTAPAPTGVVPAPFPEVAATEQAAPPAPVEKPAARAVGNLRPRPNATVQSPPVPAAPAFDVAAFIDELNVLRRRGQYAEAAARLESALKQDLPDATSERLSYELGDILTWQLKDTARACEVWSNLRAQHPNGRYSTEVKRATDSLGCR